MNGKVILIDEQRCDGCMLCAVACSLKHHDDIVLDRAQIKVWRTEDGLYVPLTCHHCETPSCAQACPTKACRVDEEGRRVIIDDRRCIACRACNVSCPFGHAHYDVAARVSAKCDYCGGEPECVKACLPQAIRYVYSDESSLHRRRSAAMVEAAQRLLVVPATEGDGDDAT